LVSTTTITSSLTSIIDDEEEDTLHSVIEKLKTLLSPGECDRDHGENDGDNDDKDDDHDTTNRQCLDLFRTRLSRISQGASKNN